MENAGVRITLVFLMPCSEGHFGSKIDQKTHSGNQNQVHGPTESFLARRNRRFLFKCARWSYISTAVAEEEIDLQTVNAGMLSLEQKITEAKDKHNAFLKQLGLAPLP